MTITSREKFREKKSTKGNKVGVLKKGKSSQSRVGSLDFTPWTMGSHPKDFSRGDTVTILGPASHSDVQHRTLLHRTDFYTVPIT
jgi:hypothetical protein